MSGVTTDYRFAPIPEQLLFDPSIDTTAKCVYAVLLRHGMSPDDCYPSHKRIGDLLGMSARSIQRPLRVLEEAGWVLRSERHDDRGDRISDGFHVRTSPGTTALLGAPPAPESAHPPAQESAHPPRSGTRTREREPVNESHLEREEGPGDTSPTTALVPPPDPAVIKERNRAALDKLPKRVDPEDVKALCLHLRERMYRHHGGPGKATVTPNWVSEMGRLLNSGPKDVDGYVPTATEVHSMIDSIFDHLNEPQGNGTFCWATVIRSPGNLRKKWMAVSGALRAQGPRVAQSDVLAAMRKLDEMGVRRV